MRATLLLLCLPLLAATPARAQIYAWHDARGTLVLSDHQAGPNAVTFPVPQSRVFRATQPVPPATVAAQYEPLIQAHAANNRIPADLVRAVIQVESRFNPRARSPKGAMGLMQLMPDTARRLGVRDAYEPEQNVRAGTAYLRSLLDRFEGDETLALAAYNAGPEAVDRYGRQVPPFEETRNYVRQVGRAGGATAARPAPRPAAARVIYKVVEVVDGREVTRYATDRPAPGASYAVVGR